ncbi:MAG TPA: hypothetical protein VFN07_00975 [Trueperaceae bacterium]|nr:hypothetical protein [Trueperaceae bacterium]
MTPPLHLLPPDPDLGQVAFAAGRAWRYTVKGWTHQQLSALGTRAEWLALGLQLDVAFRRHATAAEVITKAIASGNLAALRLYLARAHLDGRKVARLLQGGYLRVSPYLDRRTAARWLESGQLYSQAIANRLEAARVERTTFLQLRSWVVNSGQQAVWAGHDAEADEVATLAEAEYKTWVRAWPRQRRRDWHDRLEGVSIPIDTDFVLPDGPNAGRRITGPRAWDDVDDPAEWMNCGHALRFEKVLTREQAEPALRGRSILYDPRPKQRPPAN